MKYQEMIRMKRKQPTQMYDFDTRGPLQYRKAVKQLMPEINRRDWEAEELKRRKKYMKWGNMTVA